MLIIFAHIMVVSVSTIANAATVVATNQSSSNRPFLDVYIRVEPVDDFCGALQCNISYAILLTNMHNKFDMRSLMLQDGHMPRRRSHANGATSAQDSVFFEDNTVVRLSDELLRNKGEKTYLGLMFFDLPDDIQDYLIVEVTTVIRTGSRVKTEFSSDTVRIGVQVYRRNEVAEAIATADHSAQNEPQRQERERQRHGATMAQLPKGYPSPSSFTSSKPTTMALAFDTTNHNNNNDNGIINDDNDSGTNERWSSSALIEEAAAVEEEGKKTTPQHTSTAGAADAVVDGAVVAGAGNGTLTAAATVAAVAQRRRGQCGINVAERSCACCEHVTVRKIRLDDQVCVNVTYLPNKIGIRLALSVNDRVYVTKDLAVLNAESVCVEVPELREYASICVQLYNMELKEKKFTGCAKLEAILLHLRVAQHKIGCFTIPI